MKKKLATLLVSVLGVTVASAGVACTPQQSQQQQGTKAENAYTVTGDTDGNINVAYSSTTVNLTSYVTVQSGFEIKFYSDEACTQEVQAASYALSVGSNVVYAKITEIGKENNSDVAIITFVRAQRTSLDASEALKLNGQVYAGGEIKVGSAVSSVNLTSTFTLENGYGMTAYADSACTQALTASDVAVEPGANTVYLKVTENVDSTNSYVFRVNVYKTRSYSVTLRLPAKLFPDALPQVVSVDEKTVYEALAPELDSEAYNFRGWYLQEDFIDKYNDGAISSDIELFADVREKSYSKSVKFLLESKDGLYKEDPSLAIAEKSFKGAVKAADFETEIAAVTGFELKDFEKTADGVVVRLARKTFDVVFKNSKRYGSEVIDTVSVKYGLTPTAPVIADIRRDDEKTDKLAGWNAGDELYGADLAGFEVSGDVVFVAEYDTVSTTYSITALSGTGYTVTIVTDQSGLKKNASFQFDVILDTNYSHCKDDIEVYLGDTKVTQHVLDRYTAVVPGDAVIRVEGVVENSYSVTLASTFADDNFYGVSASDADDIGYAVDVSDSQLSTVALKDYEPSISVDGLRIGAHTVKFVRKSDRVVLGVKEFTLVPTTAKTVDLGSVELGNIYISGFTKDGDVFRADASKAGTGELIGVKFGDNFILDYEVEYNATSTEKEPAYGFTVSAGGDSVSFGLYEKGVYLAVNGQVFATKTGYDAKVLDSVATFRKFTLVRKNGFVLFFVGEEKTPAFVLSGEGFASVTGTAEINDASFAANLASAMGRILDRDYVSAAILSVATNAPTAKLYSTYRQVGFVMGAEHTENYHNFRTIKINGAAAEDTFDVGDPEYSVMIGTKQAGGEGSVTYDLASYGGMLYGKQITIHILMGEDTDAENDGKGIYYIQTPSQLLVTRKDKDGNVIATTDEILGVRAINEYGDEYEYTFVANEGEDYEFEFVYAPVESKKAIVNLSAVLAGQVAGGMDYSITNEEGMVVYSGKLFRNGEFSISDLPLKAGTYKFRVEGSEYTFGGTKTFEITAEQAAANETVNFAGDEALVLKENIWGEPTSSGFSSWFDKNADDPASTYSVHFARAGIGHTIFNLRQGIADGQMISYTLKYNDKSADGSELANGTFPATGTVYNLENQEQDTYIKNTVDGNNMGITSNGVAWGAMPTGASPLTSVKGLFGININIYNNIVKLTDYSVAYDFAYLRKDGKVYFLAKYHGDENYSVVSTLDASGDVSSISLAISGATAFYLNYTYSNFAFNDNAEEVYAVLDKAYDGQTIKAKDGDGNYESITISNYGGAAQKAPVDMSPLTSNDAYKNDNNGLLRAGATFSIEADIDVWGGKYLAKGFYVQDESGNFLHIVPNGRSDAWMVSVSAGNGYASRIMPTCSNTNIDTFFDINSQAKFTYHAKLIVEGDVYTLYYNGQKVFEINLREEYETKKPDQLAFYPSGSYLTLGVYEFGDGISYSQYRNIKVSYANESAFATLKVKGADDYKVLSEAGVETTSFVAGMNAKLRVAKEGYVVDSATVNDEIVSAKCVDYAAGIYEIPFTFEEETNVEVEWSQAKAVAPVTVSITNLTDNAYTFTCGELTFSGTAQSGVISAELPAGEWTLEIKTTGNLFGKTMTIEIPENSTEPIDRNVTLEVNEFGVRDISSKIVAMSKDEQGINVSIEDLYRNGGVSYNILPKLSNGQMIKFTYKGDPGFGYDENGINRATTTDSYLKFAVGAPGTDVGNEDQIMGLKANGEAFGKGTAAVKPSPFSSIVQNYQNENWDITYDLAYVRIDDVVYFLGKYGTADKYDVLLSKNLGAGVGAASVNLRVASGGGIMAWVKYSFLHMQYVTDSAEVTAFYEAANK